MALAALTACSKSTDNRDDPPPGGGSGALYMHTGNTSNPGLYQLSTQNGTATRLGDGIIFQTGTSRMGLTGRGPNAPLLGTDTLDLYQVRTTGATPQSIAVGCGAYGLAYDVTNDALYRSIGNTLTRNDSTTCDVLQTLTSSQAMDGLAFDSDGGTLYGIGADDGNLYAMELATAAPYTWTAVFDTGVSGWNSAGLAFDAENKVLYAVGHPTDQPGLYRIDPTVPSVQRVGDTGLGRAHGGLAWRYEELRD